MDGWTAGNILFEGVIGVIVDASTKAGHKFPENVVVTLYRKTFTTQEELDAWYDIRWSGLVGQGISHCVSLMPEVIADAHCPYF